MRRTAVVLACFLMTGCSIIQQESFTLTDGTIVDYIHGKIDADGQTGVFRDAYISGQPVVSSFGSGPSLWGQILQGSGTAAVWGGMGMGAAALLRPDVQGATNAITNIEAAKLSSSAPDLVAPTQPVTAEPTTAPVNVNINNVNKNSNRNLNNLTNKTKVGDLGGSSTPTPPPPASLPPTKGNNGYGNGGHDGVPGHSKHWDGDR